MPSLDNFLSPQPFFLLIPKLEVIRLGNLKQVDFREIAGGDRPPPLLLTIPRSHGQNLCPQDIQTELRTVGNNS